MYDTHICHILLISRYVSYEYFNILFQLIFYRVLFLPSVEILSSYFLTSSELVVFECVVNFEAEFVYSFVTFVTLIGRARGVEV